MSREIRPRTNVVVTFSDRQAAARLIGAVPLLAAIGFSPTAAVISSHQPDRAVPAHRRGRRPPPSLGARGVAFDWRVPTKTVRGLPVWMQATILVAAAERPAAHNWRNADDWLDGTFRAATAEDLLREAEGRRTSTLARLGYLAQWATRNDMAEAVEALLPSRLPVTLLGPRDRRAQWSRHWNV